MRGADAFRTFDDFQVGETLGRTVVHIGKPEIEGWQRLGHTMQGTEVPAGLLVALLMRGYGEAVDRRPPGNVHAGLNMDFGQPAQLGDALEMTFTCAGAELRKGRRWADLDAVLTAAGRRIAEARLTLIWSR